MTGWLRLLLTHLAVYGLLAWCWVLPGLCYQRLLQLVAGDRASYTELDTTFMLASYRTISQEVRSGDYVIVELLDDHFRAAELRWPVEPRAAITRRYARYPSSGIYEAAGEPPRRVGNAPPLDGRLGTVIAFDEGRRVIRAWEGNFHLYHGDKLITDLGKRRLRFNAHVRLDEDELAADLLDDGQLLRLDTTTGELELIFCSRRWAVRLMAGSALLVIGGLVAMWRRRWPSVPALATWLGLAACAMGLIRW